jgi:hypothetical protein
VPLDPAFLRRAQDRHAGQLGAVIGDAGDGLAALSDDGIALSPDAQAGQRGVGDQCQAFAGEVFDNGQDTKPPAVVQLIMQKIQRPALIRGPLAAR